MSPGSSTFSTSEKHRESLAEPPGKGKMLFECDEISSLLLSKSRREDDTDDPLHRYHPLADIRNSKQLLENSAAPPTGHHKSRQDSASNLLSGKVSSPCSARVVPADKKTLIPSAKNWWRRKENIQDPSRVGNRSVMSRPLFIAATARRDRRNFAGSSSKDIKSIFEGNEGKKRAYGKIAPKIEFAELTGISQVMSSAGQSLAKNTAIKAKPLEITLSGKQQCETTERKGSAERSASRDFPSPREESAGIQLIKTQVARVKSRACMTPTSDRRKSPFSARMHTSSERSMDKGNKGGLKTLSIARKNVIMKQMSARQLSCDGAINVNISKVTPTSSSPAKHGTGKGRSTPSNHHSSLEEFEDVVHMFDNIKGTLTRLKTEQNRDNVYHSMVNKLKVLLLEEHTVLQSISKDIKLTR
jgi:hypothetical protein